MIKNGRINQNHPGERGMGLNGSLRSRINGRGDSGSSDTLFEVDEEDD